MKRFIAILLFVISFSFAVFIPLESYAHTSVSLSFGFPGFYYPYPRSVYVVSSPVYYARPYRHYVYPTYYDPYYYNQAVVFGRHHHRHVRAVPYPYYFGY